MTVPVGAALPLYAMDAVSVTAWPTLATAAEAESVVESTIKLEVPVRLTMLFPPVALVELLAMVSCAG